MITTILILLALAAAAFWFWKKGIFIVAEKYAVSSLESILFSKGDQQKDRILSSMMDITNNKYAKEELLDYFLKIKGLQVVNFGKPVDFWTKKYLTSPTRLKLNYFEQVKFYETFLNYHVSGEIINTRDSIEEEYTVEPAKNVFLHKKQLA